MAGLSVVVNRSNTAPNGQLLAMLYNRDTAKVVSTATFNTADIGDQGTWPKYVSAVFGPDVNLTPNSNGYRLYFWAPANTNAGYYYPQIMLANRTGFDGAAGFMQITNGQSQNTTSVNPSVDNQWGDDAGGQPWDIAFQLNIDETPPEMAVTMPPVPDAEGTFMQNMPFIQGTASDNWLVHPASGVYLRVFDKSEGKTLKTDLSGWDLGWVPVNWIATRTIAGNPVTWNFATAAWLNSAVRGHELQVEFRAKDGVGNYSLSYTTLTFTYDLYQAGASERPNSYTTFPAENAFHRVANFVGYANDRIGSYDKSGRVSFIEYSAREYPTGKWYDGVGGFAAGTEQWFGGVGLDQTGEEETGWTKNSAFIGAVDGSSYAFYTRVWDETRNPDQIFNRNVEVDYSSVTFTWDVGLPTTSITKPIHDTTLGTGATLYYGGYYEAASTAWNTLLRGTRTACTSSAGAPGGRSPAIGPTRWWGSPRGPFWGRP